jgi:hypothetical protein
MTNQQLLSRYSTDLEIAQILFRFHHDHTAVKLLESLREELAGVPDTATVKALAARTARGLGGMGSIGESASGLNDKLLACLVEDLNATCQQIVSSLP